MNLYHVKRTIPYGYDEYSDFVVVAATEREAQLSKPSEYGSWVAPSKARATLIGKAAEGLKQGTIICASYHAG